MVFSRRARAARRGGEALFGADRTRFPTGLAPREGGEYGEARGHFPAAVSAVCCVARRSGPGVGAAGAETRERWTEAPSESGAGILRLRE